MTRTLIADELQSTPSQKIGSSLSPQPLGEKLSPAQLLQSFVVAGTSGEMPKEIAPSQCDEAAARLSEIDPGALYDALTEAICARHPDVAMQWMLESGALKHFLPELEATVDFSQEGGRRHKDVWDHTKTVVLQAVPRPIVRWAAVLHDIGKVPTRKFLGNGKVTFHGHAEVGARMYRRVVCKRIHFPQPDRKIIEELIRYHLRAGQYDGSWTDSAVRRFAKDMGPLLTDLLDLSRADITSKRPGKRKACLRMLSALAKRIRELEAEDNKPKPLPPGLGNLLMKELDLPPGKHLAVLRERLEELFEAGEIHGGEESSYYVAQIRTRSLLEGIEIMPPKGFKKQKNSEKNGKAPG